MQSSAFRLRLTSSARAGPASILNNMVRKSVAVCICLGCLSDKSPITLVFILGSLILGNCHMSSVLNIAPGTQTAFQHICPAGAATHVDAEISSISRYIRLGQVK